MDGFQVGLALAIPSISFDCNTVEGLLNHEYEHLGLGRLRRFGTHDFRLLTLRLN